jgi:hypothetical protein
MTSRNCCLGYWKPQSGRAETAGYAVTRSRRFIPGVCGRGRMPSPSTPAFGRSSGSQSGSLSAGAISRGNLRVSRRAPSGDSVPISLYSCPLRDTPDGRQTGPVTAKLCVLAIWLDGSCSRGEPANCEHQGSSQNGGDARQAGTRGELRPVHRVLGGGGEISRRSSHPRRRCIQFHWGPGRARSRRRWRSTFRRRVDSQVAFVPRCTRLNRRCERTRYFETHKRRMEPLSLDWAYWQASSCAPHNHRHSPSKRRPTERV